MDENKNKLPQNINNLIMEIGEKQVLLRLFLLIQKSNKSWNVFYNINDPGYDIVLLNKNNNKKLQIEVKTRQRIYTTSKNITFSFTLTENEYNNIDFLVAYYLDKNIFFIVPKLNIQKTTSKGKNIYYYKITESSGKTLNNRYNEYLDRWDLIENML